MATSKKSSEDDKNAETAPDSSQADEKLIKQYIHADSTAEVKRVADKIISLDPDIDVDELDKSNTKFQKEKKEDALKEAENDADFEQPK